MTAPQVSTPPTPPNKYGGDPIAFDAAMQTTLNWMSSSHAEHTAQADWLNERANMVEASYAAAGTLGVLASTATAAAVAAVVAQNNAIAAWAASAAPAESLPAISKSMHIGTVVKAIIYDTSKDSDGGAWRKRCQDKSWFTEALGGDRWLGQQATIAAAWMAAGSTTGAVYQASATAGAQTAGLYYTPTSSTTVTQVFRGISREFPALAGIVAESTRVVIYDLTQATCPMWMVFSGGGMAGYGVIITAVAAMGGQLSIAAQNGLTQVRFLSEFVDYYQGGNHRTQRLIATRNANNLSGTVSTPTIVNDVVKDVAITVLDTAPTDPATGLPVPTIAVATAGGVSVIKDDGAVGNITYGGLSIASIAFDKSYNLHFSLSGYINSCTQPFPWVFSTANPPTGGKEYKTIPFPGGASASKVTTNGARGSNDRVTLVKENLAEFTSGMVSYISNAYNSGWLPGDIRGAYLADTTAETITASGELVTNGTFTTDTTGWTVVGGTFAASAGAGFITSAGGLSAYAYQILTTVVGKTYQLSMNVTRGLLTANPRFSAATTQNASNLGVFQATADGFAMFNFTATTTSTYISVFANDATVGATATFDNISVKLADPDRSVKNTGLVVNGTLTKTAVATGAGLVAYSGFNAANYLEQPYNSQLDFGTGDISIVLWHKQAVIGTLEYLLNRDSVAAGKAIRLWVNASGFLVFEMFDGTTTRTATGAVSVGTGWNHIVCTYTAGTLTIYLNGVSYATATGAALLTMTNATAITRIGYSVAGASPATNASLALLRLSATIPSVV